MDDGSASVFCFTPLRVPVSELGRLAACPPAQSLVDRLRSVPPRLCRRAPVRSARGWSRSSRRSGSLATGRPCTRGPSIARPSSRAEVERLQALLRLREQQLFGRKTETAAATAPSAPDSPHADTGRRDGHAASNAVGPGPKRRDYSHLPAVVEDHGPSARPVPCARSVVSRSPTFRAPRIPTILEVDVRAHRRVIRRRRYRPTCSCGAHPGIVTAPPPPRLIPKSILGVSIWVTVLLDKYLFYRPTYRLLADWATLRPGPVAGHGDRRPEADGAALRAGVRGAW